MAFNLFFLLAAIVCTLGIIITSIAVELNKETIKLMFALTTMCWALSIALVPDKFTIDSIVDNAAFDTESVYYINLNNIDNVYIGEENTLYYEGHGVYTMILQDENLIEAYTNCVNKTTLNVEGLEKIK